MNQSKRKSWKNYVSNLNMHASIKKFGTPLEKNKGKGTAEIYKHLQLGKSGNFDLSWSQAIIIPISNPGKDNTDPNYY